MPFQKKWNARMKMQTSVCFLLGSLQFDDMNSLPCLFPSSINFTVSHSCFNLSMLSGVSVANSVKAALSLSTVPEELLCRNAESAKVEDFCRKHIQDRRPGSMYVCGCPGTGKTLTMEIIKLKAAQWSAEVHPEYTTVLTPAGCCMHVP